MPTEFNNFSDLIINNNDNWIKYINFCKNNSSIEEIRK